MRLLDLKFIKYISFALLIGVIALSCLTMSHIPDVEAKTTESAPAENVFFYVVNQQGKSILLDVIPVNELQAIAHGQLSNLTDGVDTGINYYFSCTDNLPTTVYTEAQGLTIPELVNYVGDRSAVAGASSITYAGNDIVYLMATDSNGIYNRSWRYNQLYSSPSYYFPDLFTKWNSAWEISDDTYTPSDTNPIPLDIYNTLYKDSDAYYNDKRQVFNGGELTTPIFATELDTVRVSLLSEEIAANNNQITGCLADQLSADRGLQLCIPQFETTLMSGNRTAYHYFAWVYNLKLSMSNAPAIDSLGSVAAPTATISQDGNLLSITLNCATPEAKIYYSLTDGSPQTLYNGQPIIYDVTGKDLASSPVNFTITGVKEGYDDAGIISLTYPARSPALNDVYSAIVGQNVTFTASSSVSEEAWLNWSEAITEISCKYPSSSSYTQLDTSKYTINNSTRSITFDQTLFNTFGSHSLQIVANGYANKTISVTMKKPTPAVETGLYHLGSDIELFFDDTSYQTGLSVSIKAQGSTASATISGIYLTQTTPGQVTIKKTYYNASSCVIKAPGIYELTLSNSNYSPSAQVVTINIIEETGEPEIAFEYILTPDTKTPLVGEAFKVSISLISSVESYTFFAGEYRLVLDNAFLSLGDIKSSGIWSSGVKNTDDQTILTFAAMDMSGDGLTNSSATEVGYFTVTPVKAGTSSLLCTQALLTDANAEALSNVQSESLEIFINDTGSSNGDVNGDGNVDISDVMQIINISNGNMPLVAAADLNNDGVVDIIDIMQLINLALA